VLLAGFEKDETKTTKSTKIQNDEINHESTQGVCIPWLVMMFYCEA